MLTDIYERCITQKGGREKGRSTQFISSINGSFVKYIAWQRLNNIISLGLLLMGSLSTVVGFCALFLSLFLFWPFFFFFLNYVILIQEHKSHY